MKLRGVNLQVNEKKLFHTSSFLNFAFIFSEYITIASSEDALKLCEHNFSQEIHTKSSVPCNLPVQLWLIKVNFLHMAFDVFVK